MRLNEPSGLRLAREGSLMVLKRSSSELLVVAGGKLPPGFSSYKELSELAKVRIRKSEKRSSEP